MESNEEIDDSDMSIDDNISTTSSDTSPQELTNIIPPALHSFFQLYMMEQNQQTNEDDEPYHDDFLVPTNYIRMNHLPHHLPPDLSEIDDISFRMRCYRTESGRIRVYERIERHNRVELSNGHTIRFREEDGLYLLLPTWFESDSIVRKIVARIPRSVAKRLRFLSKIVDEEEGYDNEGNMTYYHLRDQVFESYLVETRLKNAMRKLWVRWRNYQMDKRPTETMDPITLCEPEKHVVIYDWKARRRFIFDAKSLAILIETQLLYHTYGFPSPQYPRNPWTNIDFTYIQLVSIYYQLKAHGELRWGFITLREHNFNKTTWFQYHRSALVVKSIRSNIINLDSVCARELLEDFIYKMIEEIMPVSDQVILAYRVAILHVPHHWYIEQWKKIAIKYYEGLHFDSMIGDDIGILRSTLLQKQYMLFRDLYKLGLIACRMIT